jgi:Alkylmercury lyase
MTTLLGDDDLAVRGHLTRAIAELGHAPSTTELAARASLSIEGVEASLQRLHDTHSLLLHPGSTSPWVVHPFALSPGACWVQTPSLGYWANCLYCAFGIAAALRRDAVISTRLAGEATPVTFAIRNGAPPVSTEVFHLSTPVARWWDNVIHACASFQPFASAAEIDPWCARHALPRGAVMTLPALWAFASDWYGAYVDSPWRKRTPDEVRALFTRHGLVGQFWAI